MANILLVDDEENILELIRYNLEKDGHTLTLAADGHKALQMAESLHPDVILLDIMLPGLDGWEVCRRINANPVTAHIPIVILTAKKEEIDKVLGLEMGADDYITKPFSPREVSARVKAVLRRTASSAAGEAKSNELTAGPIVINLDKYQVEVNGEPKDLTPKEFELLSCLLANKGKVLKRDYLLERIWGYDYSIDTRTVDVHIRYLRQKLETDPSRPRLIETVRGVGYRVTEKNEDPGSHRV